MGAKENILALLLKNVGKEVSRKELRDVAGISEWARRVRELSQEGWDIKQTATGRILRSAKKKATDTKRINISQKLRYEILQRDNSRCRRCGATVEDGVQLRIDHIIPVDWGGPTTESNLWTLCDPCNSGKKAWVSDIKAEEMKKVLKMPSGFKRLEKYFRLKKGKVCTKQELIIVAGIADYARRIRELRKAGMDIRKEGSKGDYVFHGDKK